MFDKPATAGQIEYEASASLVSGEELPAWGDLSSSAKEAWESVGQAVIDSTVPERTP